MTGFRKFLCNTRGAAAIEFALIGLPVVLLFIGLVEFGRGLHVRNALNDAADRAQRAVLVNPALSDSDLEDRVRATFRGGPADGLIVSNSLLVLNGLNYRRVDLSFDMRLLLPTPVGRNLTLATDRMILIR